MNHEKYLTQAKRIYELVHINKTHTLSSACKALGYSRSTVTPHYRAYEQERLNAPKAPAQFMKTSQGIAFVYGQEIVNVSSDNRNFEKVYDALKNNDVETAFELSCIMNSILKYAYGDVSISNDKITYKGREFDINNSIGMRIIEDMRNGDFEFEKYVKFLDHILKNPSKRTQGRVYDFLVAADIEIDQDGFILAFKKVREDYKDVHSNTFDNSPGQVVSMDRSDVNDDDERVCSSGLHLCSKSYIPHFGGSRIVLCKLNPKDVVSVPTDYNDAKLRCCQYEVLMDVTDKM